LIAELLVVLIAVTLAFGHVWWGRQVPLKELERLGNPVPILASYHACWYHISIVFLVTAAVSAAHALTSWRNPELLWVLWIIVFGCWVTYLGVVYAYPSMRRLGWGQITLMLVLLICFGWQAFEA
jgi:hypothetical protein